MLGYYTDKKDHYKKDTDEQPTYNLTSTQLYNSNRIRSICNKFVSKANQTIKVHKSKTAETNKTLKNLSKDNTIQITKPDKGRGIVIMDKDEYNYTMLNILKDTTTFKELKNDITIIQEDKLTRKLKQLKNDKFITEHEYHYCKPCGSQPGRIYGLPKIHKPNAPLRPIISASGTYNYYLAKMLTKKLNHLRKSDLIITNTFDFVSELHSIRMDPTQIKIVSFDITSLFTKVPLARTIQLILEKMYGPEHTCMYGFKKITEWCNNCKNRFEMKWLLNISTKESHFIYDEKIYSQINGIAMGSPLGPLFADIYINYLENKLMPRLKRDGVLFWRRFVDDTFVILEKNANVDNINEILNSFDQDITFTREEETNNSISFLDIFITRKPTNQSWITTSSFDTTIYRKSTYTGLITKWDSFVPDSYKVSTISSMIYRAIKICSSFKLIHKQFQTIKDIATKNGYPIKFVNAQIRKTLGRYFDKTNGTHKHCSKKTTNKETDNNIKKTQILIDIPFYGKPTNILGKRLINLAKSINPKIHVQSIQRPSLSISNYFQTKDKIPKELQSNIVYRVNCCNCKSSYIGKTIRQATRRLSEHGAKLKYSSKLRDISSITTNNTDTLRRSKRIIRKMMQPNPADESNNNVNKTTKTHNSAIKQHELTTKHIINWNDWEILTKEKNHYRLSIKESLSITKYQPSLNKTSSSVPLIVYPEGLQSKPKVKMKSMNHIPPEGEE